MKGIYIFLANGFEDIEALAVCDVLRRGGAEVKLVSVNNPGEGKTVTSSHGVSVNADIAFQDLPENSSPFGESLLHTVPANTEDVMIFPGGMPGSRTLAACSPLIEIARRHYNEGGSLAAICAAPGLVLSQLDLPEGMEFTCFDGFQDALIAKGCRFTGRPAVRSGRIITGRSAGHAVSFGLEILKLVKGEKAAEEVAHALYLD